jgi:hypothetical protein
MQAPKPALGYGINKPKPANHKELRVLGIMLLWILFIVGFISTKNWITLRRQSYQVAELRAILSQNPVAFRKVYIFGAGGDFWKPAPDVGLEGYVQTQEQLEQLRSEMSKRLGKELGETVYLSVGVIPAGTIVQGDTQDFWSK